MNILINTSTALRFAVLANAGGVHDHLSVGAVSLTTGKSIELPSAGIVAFDDLLAVFSAHVSELLGGRHGGAGVVDYDLLLRHIEAYKNNLYGLHLKQQSGYTVAVEALRDCYVSRFAIEISNIFSNFDSGRRAEFEGRIRCRPGSSDSFYSESLDLADFYSQWCSVAL
ncbi:hypothetical protein [Lysobacter sp. Root667]|uniref:hypothetical protein n=1 Tax=Lysobacter sp. Root667 TaxID=1736581 RepID=UPI0012DD1642|nr:hypothetical protein [Lysobacter sp. Root667]